MISMWKSTTLIMTMYDKFHSCGNIMGEAGKQGSASWLWVNLLYIPYKIIILYSTYYFFSYKI